MMQVPLEELLELLGEGLREIRTTLLVICLRLDYVFLLYCLGVVLLLEYICIEIYFGLTYLKFLNFPHFSDPT